MWRSSATRRRLIRRSSDQAQQGWSRAGPCTVVRELHLPLTFIYRHVQVGMLDNCVALQAPEVVKSWVHCIAAPPRAQMRSNCGETRSMSASCLAVVCGLFARVLEGEFAARGETRRPVGFQVANKAIGLCALLAGPTQWPYVHFPNQTRHTTTTEPERSY